MILVLNLGHYVCLLVIADTTAMATWSISNYIEHCASPMTSCRSIHAACFQPQAADYGVRTTIANPATNMRALGVMAFELLTIWEQLCGREPLPWDEGAPRGRPASWHSCRC